MNNSTLPAHELSIEYAHIYTNQKINEEHELSVNELRQAIGEFPAQKVVFTVMVDDYSFPDQTFDYDSFMQWLDVQGCKPDMVLRESQLIPVCDEVLKHITHNDRLKMQLEDYIKAKKYPCSLFIAAWYLLRQGYIKNSVFDDQFTAAKLLNILSTSFEPFEKKGLEIIAAAGYEDAVANISYRWVEDRLRA